MFSKLLNYHLVKYFLVGGTNTIINLLLYFVLLKLSVNYLIANVLCFIVGVLLGYILNTLLVFKQKLIFKSLLKYSTVYLFSLSLNVVILFSLVHFLGMNKMLAQVITTGLVTVVNYLAIKKLVFRGGCFEHY